MRYIEVNAKLPISHTIGVIKLIHKRNEKEILLNWRGITLLCVDYKILMKIITNRLKHIFPHIIMPEQTCAVPGRTIQENTYALRDVIGYAGGCQRFAVLRF